MPLLRFRPTRGHVALLHDLIMAGLSFVVSLYARLADDWTVHIDTDRLLIRTGLFVLVAGVVFLSLRMYRGVWRYASLNDLLNIVKAATLTVLGFAVLMFFVDRLEGLPRSVLMINWFVLMAFLGGPRFLYRLAKDRRVDLHYVADSRRPPEAVLLVGAGDAAEQFIRSMNRAVQPDFQVLGMVSLKPRRVGMDIHGVRVMGTLEDLGKVVADLNAKGRHPAKLILTHDDLDGAMVRHLLETADGLGLTLARLPKLTDLKSGIADKVEIKPIAVEDLLGRPQARLDRDGMRALIAGRRVLVTGAGGSIGSELVRQVSDFGPAQLTLLDASEYALYSVDLELKERHPELPRAAVIADVRNAALIDRVLADHKPDLVFHAAALKHVPLVEDNPVEGVRTNTLGTRVVADACRVHRVRGMVMISTDKAVNPTNVMGATKRMAEMYCQALDVGNGGDGTGPGTHFVTVRFGNVLGSTGSVVPLFQRQLHRGGPLTVTHAEVTRFFMTIHEAVELVLQAATLGHADDKYRGKLFVLDMGEPVKIIDLARQMIRLAGLRPDEDVKIEITGLRPGEKLYEEVLHDAETTVPTEIDGIRVAAPRASDRKTLAASLERLDRAVSDLDRAALMDTLGTLVPEYHAPDHAA